MRRSLGAILAALLCLSAHLSFAQTDDATRIETLKRQREVFRQELEDGRGRLFIPLDFGGWAEGLVVPASKEFIERAIRRHILLADPQQSTSQMVREMLQFDRDYRQRLNNRLDHIERELAGLLAAQSHQQPPVGSLFDSPGPQGPQGLPSGIPSFDQYLEQSQQQPQPPLPTPAPTQAGPLQANIVSFKCAGPHGTMSGGRVVSNYRCDAMIDITNTGTRELYWVDRFVDATGVDGNVHQEKMAYHRPEIWPGQTVRVNGYCVAPEPSWSGQWKAYGSARDKETGQVFRWEASGTCP
jgi:hypothetical protein